MKKYVLPLLLSAFANSASAQEITSAMTECAKEVIHSNGFNTPIEAWKTELPTRKMETEHFLFTQNTSTAYLQVFIRKTQHDIGIYIQPESKDIKDQLEKCYSPDQKDSLDFRGERGAIPPPHIRYPL